MSNIDNLLLENEALKTEILLLQEKKTVFTAQKSSLIFLSFERTGNVMSQSMF